MSTDTLNTEAVLAELRALRERIEAGQADVTEAYARRLELFQRARAAEPPMPNRVLAEASGVTEVAVIQCLAKRRLQDEARTA